VVRRLPSATSPFTTATSAPATPAERRTADEPQPPGLRAGGLRPPHTNERTCGVEYAWPPAPPMPVPDARTNARPRARCPTHELRFVFVYLLFTYYSPCVYRPFTSRSLGCALMVSYPGTAGATMGEHDDHHHHHHTSVDSAGH
jgi:hypothetical protein